MTPETLLFSLIRTVICNEAMDDATLAACTPENLQAVYSFARRHDLAHLIGQAVGKLDLPESEPLEICKKAALSAFLRNACQNRVFSQVCNAFEAAAIPFIPLKGMVLQDFYPEPWLRTSSDLDILVQPEDLERATALLTETLDYKYVRTASHDVSFFSPEQVYLELHYSTIEDFVSKAAAQVMGTIWDKATPVPGFSYRLQIPDDLFYYYHIAHAAKHFLNGGSGIRAFLDIWILENRVSHSRKERESLLKKGGLLTFALAAERLSRIWFQGEPADQMSDMMQSFIFSGGNFGTLENKVSISQSRKGGKLKYALSRIFLPYSILQYHYPVLQKHKLLFPLFQVVRWFKLLFCGGAGRSIEELQATADVTPEQQQIATALLNYLHLK